MRLSPRRTDFRTGTIFRAMDVQTFLCTRALQLFLNAFILWNNEAVVHYCDL
jgi:hypothetical protein